jgi:ribosome maturation factor RimP
MIDKNVVRKLVDEWLEENKEKSYFLVDIQVSQDNKVVVEIDHKDGVVIDDCVLLSSHINDNLDREVEDYELEVGSTGLGQPFKIAQQYVNNIGNDVEVLAGDGKKYKGVLKSVDGNDFVVSINEKVQVEGKKRPVKMDVDHTFQMDQVKYTKYIISFK